MKLPNVTDPARYQGLYVFDFGEWTAVGYTADEIAVLLEQETYRDGNVFKIHNVSPSGQFELRGISRERFQHESGMFFNYSERRPAVDDYERLRAAVRDAPPPTRAMLHVVHCEAGDLHAAYRVALIFPAEYEDEMGRWLESISFFGGETSEGGISRVTDFNRESHDLIEREQLWPAKDTQSRACGEILSNVRVAVQR